jgi:putative MATE family efflux protein
MSSSRPPSEETAQAIREVEEGIEEIGDPEASPANPSATLAVGARAGLGADPGRRRRLVRTGTTLEIWRLAWPVMLSQSLATGVGLIDIAMVGRLGAAEQAAVGYASQLFFFGQSALFAIGFSCVALMARAIGGGDAQRARYVQVASVGLSLITSSLLAAVFLAAPRTLLGWLSAEPQVIELCIPYLQLLMLSSVLLAACLTLESGLRANRDMRTPMQIALAVTVAKVALNGPLIFGWLGVPRLELVGAGLATLASQVLAVILFGLVLARTPRHSPTALHREDLAGALALVPPLVRIALPGIAERVIMNLAMLSYFVVLGSYGTAAVAAYTIGVRILSFSWIPGTGYAQAVGTLVGHSLGAGDEAAAERAGWRAARLALVTAVALGALGGFLREPLARLFTADATTIEELLPFMLMLAIAQPMLQLHFTLGGAHRGAGDTWTPLVASFVGNWVFRVPLAVACAHWLDLPLIWVWGAILFDHLARALWLTASFRRGRWRNAPA